MSLKTSILLFKGENFKNCGPKRTFFCPEMENVNDLISYTYNYNEIKTTNTSLEVGNLDARYKHFVDEAIKILGKKVYWVSIYNKELGLHDILYNPLDKPKGRVPTNSTTTRPKKGSDTNNKWDDITIDVYKNMDAKSQFEILFKYANKFQDEKYCKFLKLTDLDKMDSKLYNRLMSYYYHAKIPPCIPITMYIIDPKIVALYPPQDRLKFIKKYYKDLEDPHEYLASISINDLSPTILKHVADKTPFFLGDVQFVKLADFKALKNPFVQLKYLLEQKATTHERKWLTLFNAMDKTKVSEDKDYKQLLDDYFLDPDHPNTTRRRQGKRRVQDTSYDALLQGMNPKVLDKNWNDLTIQEMKKAQPPIKNKLLEKHLEHFKDEKYCSLLQSSYDTVDHKLFEKIIEKYVKARLRPCVPLEHFEVEPYVFKLYPEKDRMEYFDANYKILDNPHDFLPYLNVSKLHNQVLKFIANRKPSDFIKISWDNMTPSKFAKESNPYMQIEYLSKYGPNYYTTKKWQQLYAAVDSRVHDTPEYRLLKIKTDIPMTKEIETCVKNKSVNELVDLAIKRFGGNKNSYLKMTHAALCDLIEKKHLVIQTKKTAVNKYNEVTDYHYTKALSDQMKYVDSLDPKTKSALQRYTHQFDWQVNQILMMKDNSKPTVESLKHPNPNPDNTFNVDELDYGYEHVLNKNIKDVQRRLDVAFANVPPLKHSLVVYRGVKYNRGEKYSHDPIYNKQYISTSTEESVAENFVGNSCCILYITLPMGTHVLPLERITHYPGEYEVLLPRNGKIQVYKQEGKKVYATFEQDVQLKKKPVRLYDELVSAINIKLTMPPHVHSIVAGTMGPGIFNGNQYVYNFKGQGIPYVVKKLPFIIMLKKLTKDYKDTSIVYNVITNQNTVHKLEIKGGNIFENGKIIKFTGGVGGGKVINKPPTSPKKIVKPTSPKKIVKPTSPKKIVKPTRPVENIVIQKKKSKLLKFFGKK
jgi:hypothetical protein